MQVVLFGPAFLGVFAKDFARRGQEELLPALDGETEKGLGWVNVGFDCPHGIVRNEFHADGGCEMVDDVDAAENIGEQHGVCDGTGAEVQSRVRFDVAEVFFPAGRQVVEDGDFIAAAEEMSGEVTADEPGSPGDKTMRHS